MANRLLKNIAVTIGVGLAIGIGRKHAARAGRHRPAPNLHPILTRLDNIEHRVTRFEISPSSIAVPAPEEIEALGTLVSSQSEDIAALRQDILRIERRNAEQVEAFTEKVSLLERQLPAHIESSVSARMTDLEHRLRGEFQEIHHRTVDAFADAIEQRVIQRINTLENSVIEQSHSIVTLREKSLQTDDHLQRLLEAVEKLCARAETQSQIALLQLERSALLPAPISEPLPEAPSSLPTPPHENAGAHRGFDMDPQPEPDPDPQSAYAAAAHSSPAPENSARRDLKAVGMAILGLAILGFRLIR